MTDLEKAYAFAQGLLWIIRLHRYADVLCLSATSIGVPAWEDPEDE